MKVIIGTVVSCLALGGLIGFSIGYECGREVLIDKTSEDINKLESSLKGIEDLYYTELESAYFEGQKDAIEGDLRIKKIDSCYVWTKSVWDDTKKPNTYVIPCKH